MAHASLGLSVLVLDRGEWGGAADSSTESLEQSPSSCGFLFVFNGVRKINQCPLRLSKFWRLPMTVNLNCGVWEDGMGANPGRSHLQSVRLLIVSFYFEMQVIVINGWLNSQTT
jgi:hypothetical protein